MIPILSVLMAPVVMVPAAAQDAGPATEILARVDDEAVTTRDLLILLGSQKRPASDAPTDAVAPEGVLRRLIQNRLLEQEGFRLGLAEEPEVTSQVQDLIRHRSMMALLDSLQATVPVVEPAQTVHTAPKTNTMLRVSHILVGSEIEAISLAVSLATGASFAELAERNSLDKDWSKPDGDLGWARDDKFIPEFIEALKGLEEGEISAPVRTAKGWHLLQITETHTETMPEEASMEEAAQRTEMTQRVMETIRDYVDTVKEKYGVVPDTELLATLDYGTEDSDTLRGLKENPAVLAVLPWRELTVADLTRRIRFEHFHGLAGKPEAPGIRDRAFDEYLTELLLRHEAVVLGFHKKPDIVASADFVERTKVREMMGQQILDIRFNPKPKDVEKYYGQHRDRFTLAPRIRANGILLNDEASALRFRQRLEAGAQMAWLAERTPETRDADPEQFKGWLDPQSVGLGGRVVDTGTIVGPFESEGGWAVARVVEAEAAAPVPLDECRDRVIAMMKGEAMTETMRDSVARLEEQAKVKVEDDAEEVIQDHISRWLAAAPPSSGKAPAGHMGAIH